MYKTNISDRLLRLYAVTYRYDCRLLSANNNLLTLCIYKDKMWMKTHKARPLAHLSKIYTGPIPDAVICIVGDCLTQLGG